MRNLLFVYLLLTTSIVQQVYAQTATLSFFLFDNTSRQPISNAHVFGLNSTYGGISNENGKIQLNIPTNFSEDLIISHISYETKLLEASFYHQLMEVDTIWLTANNLNVSEIVVSAKRPNKWKKNYKKFKKYFLGADKAASKCAILNPEVLRFEEDNGDLKVSSIDLLQIQNEYLGYEVNYLLTKFNVKSNGSSVYAGKAHYKDYYKLENKKQIEANRQTAYQNSPKYFFYSLITDQLATNGFEVATAQLKEKRFTILKNPTRAELVQERINKEGFYIQFPEFLQIVNKNISEVQKTNLGVRQGGLESQRFNNSQIENKGKVVYATSYLYKIAPFLEIDEFGNILNTEIVKEYGFWANQRFAHQLPFDYGNIYQTSSKKTTPIVRQTKQIKKGAAQISDNQKLKLFQTLIHNQNPSLQTQILAQVEKIWDKEFIPILIEYLRLSTNESLIQEIVALLSKKTGKSIGQDYLSWLAWLWASDPLYPNYYSDFKANYYQLIDQTFYKYFLQQQNTSKIRVDEIVWGGVRQDGIPPLRNPKLITSKEANYLEKNNIVFGVYLNGIAKAYPKRILAWHEFFIDSFGDTKIAGVYCTLCGTVIAYDMVHQGIFHDLGTSGFLYRSNKLMYDKKTQSLWNTIAGQPILGPLADKNIHLKSYSVVTTTWGEWKKLHPETKVLSLDTGYERDYAEGAAYANYFATDNLMFPVPKLDQRLNNKTEVLIIRAAGYQEDPLAISIPYLSKKKWYVGKIGTTNFVVLADKNGAARAYDIGDIKMESFRKGVLKDREGKNWTITENHLQSTDNQTLIRLSSHNIFWFAWFNAYPGTRLVK